jgi:uncharacterized protein (TIGR02996 family)
LAESGATLLQRVLETPDADEPRLVYADWLIERGDPRGDFISVQIHLRQRLSPSSRMEFKAKEAALLSEHDAEWAAPAGIADEHTFVRGFIERVRADARKFLAGFAPLMEKEPVQSLRLRCSGSSDVERLIESGLLARIPNLKLEGEIGDEGARMLAKAPHLAKLKSLNLGSTGLTSEGAAHLAASPYLGALETLSLTGNAIGSEGLAALASAPSLTNLEALFVARNEIDDDGVIDLARAPAMRTLQRLGLAGNFEITDEGARAIRESPHLKALKRCELSSSFD